jgi:HlyD family secretion protein
MLIHMKKKKIVYSSLLIILLVVAYFIFGKGKKNDVIYLETQVKKGNFEILVSVTGELQAQFSENIMAPTELRSRNLRFGQIKIQDLVPEGTVVDSGQFVASLDRTEATNGLKDIEDELERVEAQYTKIKLDTTIQLRNLRDELINMRFSMEEAKIVLDQSRFEPPATIRQAQINLDKSQRALEQAERNYQLKVQQSMADMRGVEINLARQERRRDEMMAVLDKFVIRAPKPGMVIYWKEWSGQKRKVGSSVTPWDLIVATLPDLSSMVSKTYVNEIDISRVKVDQIVRVGVDAFPEKQYTGRIIEVANVGEQLPNTDAKVFEVLIKVSEYDPILRPSMTTSNVILTDSRENVLFIPLEALHTVDSIPFVYKKSGVKQVVIPGPQNENEIIIEKGLSDGERLYLSIPENVEGFRLAGEELISELKEREAQRRKEERTRERDARDEQEARRTRRNNRER